jgi:hypothetical protein
MRRIGLAVVLVVSIVIASLAAEAQKASKLPRIGTLSASSPSSQLNPLQPAGFWQAMRELGWIEGQNILVESRWAEGGSIA